MPSLDERQSGQAYWRSLGERAQAPELLSTLGHEFSEPAMAPTGMPRRDFMRMMTVAMAAGGLSLSGCRRWPEKEVRPHASRAEGTAPGVAQYYATMYECDGTATGILAKSFDGRPIKIEGNPLHPFSLGAAGAFAQASVLELYDPDRCRQPFERIPGAPEDQPTPRRWEDFDAFARGHFSRLRSEHGKGLAVLSRPTSSPTLLRLRDEFLKAFPRATWHTYTPVHRDHEIAGSTMAFGQALRTQYHLDKARVIASFDADLIGLHPAHQRYARDWSAGRATGDQGRMNRLYIVESTFSVTGSVADHRLAVRPSRVPVLMNALASRLDLGSSADSSLDDRESQWVNQLASDLKANRGACVMAVGPTQPAAVHALAHRINDALECVGHTVTFTPEPLGETAGCIESISELSGLIRAGRASTLLILDGNPVYDAPADLSVDVAGTSGHPITSIHLSAYENETSVRCRWHLPLAHFLECWGDGRAWDGTYCVQQPLILPLFDGKSAIELLASLLSREKASGLDLVQETTRTLIDGDFSSKWDRLLHDGVFAGSAWPPSRPAQPRSARAPATAPSVPPGAMELAFVADASVYDGRFAENGWLQELPDPLTKLTWDNAALISAADATALAVTTGDVIRVRVGLNTKLSIAIPAYVMPGQAKGVVTLPLGYGRTNGGAIGRYVGANVYPLRTSEQSYLALGASVERTGRTASLAMTQDHHLIDAVGMWGREKRVGAKGESGQLIREGTLQQYQHDPHCFEKHGHDSHQLFDPPSSFNQPHAWGMAIDLNRCTGCSACVVACNVENNIPVVGKEQVANNREMSWLRIDRYFKGSVDEPDVVHAPMACVHCENAPCEQVCPVAATVHDSEGLNTMVYNRCIGTRYCSNNCPYKVRRFNYFDFHATDPRGKAKPWLDIPDRQQDELDQIKRMIFNPDVTVRMRGVMEKCTYCVQRIQSAKINAKLEHTQGRRADERVHDGEVVAACQGACPTQAITFGDLNDPKSQVSQDHYNRRAYAMLEELNLRTRTRYLAKLRNPAGGEKS